MQELESTSAARTYAGDESLSSTESSGSPAASGREYSEEGSAGNSGGSNNGNANSGSGQNGEDYEPGSKKSAIDEENEVQKKKKKDNLGQKMLKSGAKQAAGSAAHHAMMSMLLMQLKAWLMALMNSVASAVMSFFGAIWSGICAVGHAIGGFFAGAFHAVAGWVSGAVSWLSGAFGISTTAAATTLAAGATIATMTVTVTVAVNVATNMGERDALTINCAEEVDWSLEGFSGNIDAQTKHNAQLVYSVLNQYGLPDTNIAGVLANWAYESGIDPTGVEGCYGEPYTVFGPKKAMALANLDAYTIDNLFVRYENQGKSINKLAYKCPINDMFYCGLGLGQFTGPAAYDLVSIAESMQKDWWELDVQLVYCLMDGGYRSGWMASWAEEESAGSAAARFLDEWEGNPHAASRDERIASADYWLTEMASWSVDTDYAQSIIVTAGSVTNTATGTAVEKALSNCPSVETVDSNSIAAAAVAFAYRNQDEGIGNNGTDTFKAVHDSIFPSDSWYMACDIAVACAVRWSGADDNFPAHDVEGQLAYMISNKQQWKEIPMVYEVVSDPWMAGTGEYEQVDSGERNPDGTIIYESVEIMKPKVRVKWYNPREDMIPGDILICKNDSTSHVVMYVSNEEIANMYPEEAGSGKCTVSASLNERSAGCGYWSSEYDHIVTTEAWEDDIEASRPEPNSGYRIFRNIKKTANPQYRHAGSMAYTDEENTGDESE